MNYIDEEGKVSLSGLLAPTAFLCFLVGFYFGKKAIYFTGAVRNEEDKIYKPMSDEFFLCRDTFCHLFFTRGFLLITNI